jgi:acetyltransferase-like isoleucine patch superfamily enzyme
MSQLKKHLKYSIHTKYRFWLASIKLGKLERKVWIDKNVEFMRFPNKIKIYEEAIIKEGARICVCNELADISIGARTTIGYHTFIFASQRITIGDDCLIAPFVYIVDSNHQIGKTQLINQQPNETAATSIGNDVWIASNVTILKGVTINEGAVIAANSVVNNNIPAFEIWGGSPAKKIGERK